MDCRHHGAQRSSFGPVPAARQELALCIWHRWRFDCLGRGEIHAAQTFG
ncbi:Rieske 2Fe-2S domain-containing protein [Rhodoferax ferrireducens]